MSSPNSPAQLWGPTINGYLQMFRRRRAVSDSSFNMITHFKAVRTSGCTATPQPLQVVMRMFGHTDYISFQKFLHRIREILIGGWVGGGDITYIRMCSGIWGLWDISPLHRVPVFACMASCIIRHRDKHLFVNEINVKIRLQKSGNFTCIALKKIKNSLCSDFFFGDKLRGYYRLYMTFGT